MRLALAAALSGAGTVAACTADFECFQFNPCLVNARCVGGLCRYDQKNCSDGDFCTEDGCDALGVGCFNVPSCPSDGLVCNGEELCSIFVGGCFQGSPPNCDDADACTIDSCVEPTGCRHVPVNCADANACTEDACDPATGCSNTPIEGCCQTAADCPADACTERRCAGGTCTAGTSVTCDDGNPITTDGCDPATGCTHVTVATTTTTPTVAGGGGGSCTRDADCSPDDDPCSEERCAGGACTARDPAGFERLACVCRRGVPAVCGGETYPRKLARRVERACALVARARDAVAKRQGRLLGKTRTRFTQAAGLATRLGAQQKVSGLCAAATSARMTDAAARATAIRNGA